MTPAISCSRTSQYMRWQSTSSCAYSGWLDLDSSPCNRPKAEARSEPHRKQMHVSGLCATVLFIVFLLHTRLDIEHVFEIQCEGQLLDKGFAHGHELFVSLCAIL